MQARKNLFRPEHIQPAIFQRALALGGIAGDTHLIIVATFNQNVNVAARGQTVVQRPVDRAGPQDGISRRHFISKASSTIGKRYCPGREDC